MSLSAVLLLGACAPYPNYFDRGVRVAGQTTQVDTAEALVLPEPGAAPRVIAVLQSSYSNAIMQEIILETNSSTRGQNAFHVTFFGPVERTRSADYTRTDEFLNEEALETEMAAQLPGVSMYTSNYFVQNRYGPFNYAMGRGAPGELCIYAWQRIQSQVPVYRLMRDRGVLSVRLRLCQRGASEQDLLRVMYRYSINGYFLPAQWQPYGRPMGEPEGIGRVGGPLAYPSGLQGDGTVLDGWMGPEPQAAPSSRSRAPSRSSARRYGAPVAQPEPVLSDPDGYQGSGFEPQTDGYTPVDGYPVVPGPAPSAQQAPNATPAVVPGQSTRGGTVTPAPSRPVQNPSENTPFSPTTHLPGASSGTSNYAPASSGSVGAPIRLVPGASAYPTPTSGQ